MLYGTVKSYNHDKGFGFIKEDNGDDFFVHYHGLVGEGFQTLEAGQRVQFVVVEGKNGSQAAKVSVIPEGDNDEL